MANPIAARQIGKARFILIILKKTPHLLDGGLLLGAGTFLVCRAGVLRHFLDSSLQGATCGNVELYFRNTRDYSKLNDFVNRKRKDPPEAGLS